MKFYPFIVVLLLANLGLAQESKELPKNIFSIGTGLNDRGAISLEHTYNFRSRKSVFISLESSIGSTHELIDNISISPVINAGRSENYFSIGLESKYLRNRYFKVLDESQFLNIGTYKYTGLVFAPFVGYNWIGENWLNIKLRVCLNILTKNLIDDQSNIKPSLISPGIGLSMGIFQKKR